MNADKARGWNYIARLYRLRRKFLNGKWTFPEAVAND